MEVQLYTSERGRCNVGEYIESLEPKLVKRVKSCLEKIETYGMDALKVMDSKKMKGHNFWEVRIGSTRFFYIIRGETFWLLHGFTKKKQQTPLQEIRTTEERINDLDLRLLPFLSRIKRDYEIN